MREVTMTIDQALARVQAAFPKGDERHVWSFESLNYGRGQGGTTDWWAHAALWVVPVWSTNWTDWQRAVGFGSTPVEALLALETKILDMKMPKP